MRSQLAVRLGSLEPVVLHEPPDVHSLAAAEEAIELADAYGVADGFPLAESQKVTLRGALAERADGSWAATRVGDFGPRQGTGKNDKIAARELAGLILFGEQLIIHTAHEFPTANESFLRLVSVFENWDDLRKKVARIRYANGEQGIELLSGQRLKYRARTGGSGRGFAKADLVVYDEAQHLSREHVAASGPAKLSNPNSQTWYAGSGGLSTSAVAWAIRRAAILGDGGRLAYTEATAEALSVVNGKIHTEAPDPSDLDSWYQAMPGLGRWVTEESMWALYDELGPDLFARECLCVWDTDAGEIAEPVFPAEPWAKSADPAARFDDVIGVPVFAVEVTPDHAWTSISAAGWRADHRPYVEIVEHRPGTLWAPARLQELKQRWAAKTVRANLAGPAGALEVDCRKLGVDLEAVSTRENTQACGFLFDAVVGARLVRRPDELLDEALAGAVKKDIGDGAWLWSQRSSLSVIAPLIAATLALGGIGDPPKKEADFFMI